MNANFHHYLQRGDTVFNLNGESGHFVSEDGKVLIDCTSGGPEGSYKYRLRFQDVDTVFSLIREYRRRSQEENFWTVDWTITRPNIFEKFVNKSASGERYIETIEPYAFKDHDELLFIVQLMADLLWATNGRDVTGNFEVRSVRISSKIINN